MKTVIYTHPSAGSFNHEVLNRLSNSFSKNDADFQVIDLYSDGFDPLLTKEDFNLYAQGGTSDDLVKKYQRQISVSDELVFIFPIWWQNIPAILKGFFDKVMLRNFAYNEDDGWKGLLTNIKRVTVFTTSTVSTEYLVDKCGDPIQTVFINRTLSDIGIDPQNCNWVNLGEVTTTTEETRENYLNDLPKLYENN